jgi:hypothetical protein
MQERTLDEVNKLKISLEKMTLAELILFAQQIERLDFTAFEMIVDEIENRIEKSFNDGQKFTG